MAHLGVLCYQGAGHLILLSRYLGNWYRVVTESPSSFLLSSSRRFASKV